MAKYYFKKIFGWLCWLNLLILGGWAGLFVVDILSFVTRNVGIFCIFLLMTLFTFAVDALMKEHPDQIKSYFIKWLIASGLFLFFGFTVWVFLS